MFSFLGKNIVGCFSLGCFSHSLRASGNNWVFKPLVQTFVGFCSYCPKYLNILAPQSFYVIYECTPSFWLVMDSVYSHNGCRLQSLKYNSTSANSKHFVKNRRILLRFCSAGRLYDRKKISPMAITQFFGGQNKFHGSNYVTFQFDNWFSVYKMFVIIHLPTTARNIQHARKTPITTNLFHSTFKNYNTFF